MLTEGQLKMTILSPEKAMLFRFFMIYVVLSNKNWQYLNSVNMEVVLLAHQNALVLHFP